MKQRKGMKLSLIATLVVTVVCAETASAAPFQNGSFEGLVLAGDALDDGLIAVSNPDSSTIPWWTVGGLSGGSVDWVSGNIWAAEDGIASIDLSGTFGNHNWVSQTFDTVAGQDYQVSFWMAGNFLSTTIPKTMQVTVGDYSQDYTQDYAPMGSINDVAQPAWHQQTFEFQAISSLTILKFADTSGNDSEGVILDNVSVTIVPEPSSLIVLLGAFGSLLFIRRRGR
jgi:choice-of-anchor C domain-containing protein